MARLTAEKRRLDDDRQQLKTKLREVVAATAMANVERDRVQEGLKKEAAAHGATQMQLSLAQHRLKENNLRQVPSAHTTAGSRASVVVGQGVPRWLAVGS